MQLCHACYFWEQYSLKKLRTCVYVWRTKKARLNSIESQPKKVVVVVVFVIVVIIIVGLVVVDLVGLVGLVVTVVVVVVVAVVIIET